MIPSYIVHFPAANLQLGVGPAFHTRPCPSSYIWTVVIFELKKLSGREGAWGNPFNSTQRLDIRWIPHLQLAHNQLLMKHCLLYNNYLQPGSLSLLIPLTVSHVKSPYGFHLSNTLMKLAKHKPWTPMATALHWQVVEVGECFRRTRVLSHVWSKEWPFWVWRRFFWVLLM